MKRPRTKINMHSPTAKSSSSRSGELKHKSKDHVIVQSKALFSPTPNGNEVSKGGRFDIAVADDEGAEVSSGSVFTTTGNSSVVLTPKKSIGADGGSIQGSYVPDLNSPVARAAVAVAQEAASTDVAAEKQAEETSQEEDEMDEAVFNPYHFISELPSLSSIDRIGVSLPPQAETDSGKPTLVLDLDETLVHCTVEAIDKPDMTFPVTFNGHLYDVYVRKRPYLDYFLEVVSRSYEVVVFTASQRVYADVLLDLLDPDRKYIRHRLFRESCVFVNGNYLKDLHVVGRDYQKMAIVDNSPHAYGYQIENGIPIESWFDDANDTELLKLVGFLRSCFDGQPDVRPIIQEQFKTHELIARASKGLFIDLTTAPPFPQVN